MTPAPAATPDGALSRATSSPHAKTAPAVDLLPGSGRQSYTATERIHPEPRTKGSARTLMRWTWSLAVLIAPWIEEEGNGQT